MDKADHGVKVERGIPEAPSRTLCFCLTPKRRGLAVDLGQTNCAGTWLLADQNGMKCVVTEYKLSPQAHYARLLCSINPYYRCVMYLHNTVCIYTRHGLFTLCFITNNVPETIEKALRSCRLFI